MWESRMNVDDTNRPKKSTDVIKGSNNEDSTLTEETLFYDVRFDAIAPKSADSTEQEEVIRLIINVEAQTKFKPEYPLTKRAIYYCSRMISAQHGPIFTKSEYGKIRKVYSIWICTQPSDGFENTLTRYSIKPEQLIGEVQEETENYDLMSVVMICLGKPGTENHKGILKFMEVLLSSTRSGSEKKKIEMLQLLLRLGTFQVSDIVYNTLGGMLGGAVYMMVKKVHERLSK